MQIRIEDGRIVLPQGRDVVEDPERAPVRPDYNVIVMNHEIADRRRRHVQSQRVPTIAIIKGDKNVEFSSSEQQTRSLRILLHCVDWAIRQAVYDLLPRG